MALMTMSSVFAAGQKAPAKPNQIFVTATEDKASKGSSIRISLPAGVDSGSIKAVLNGKDISSHLAQSSCGQGTCLAASALPSDGAHDGKNVIYVTGKNKDGKLVTARQRFAQYSSPVAKQVSARLGSANAAAADVSGSSSFLPPTVTFKSLYSGGWDGSTPWFQVGNQQYPTTPPCPSGTIYLILAYDRQTLAPYFNDSGNCANSGSGLASYLKTLSSTQIVVVATLNSKAADNQLDTSYIGGKDHTKDSNPPDGYIVIGVPGAAPGTAYENYPVDPKGNAYYNTEMWPFATGVVQEDPNGNYNFESTDIREYWVDPAGQDAISNRTGSVTMYYPDNTYSSGTHPITGIRFLRPDSATAQGGYWLLIFNRYDLTIANGSNCQSFSGSGSNPTDGNTRVINCGAIYNTGDNTSDTNRLAAYRQLASDLSEIGPYQMGVLTTFGSPACCGTIWDITGNTNWYTEDGTEGVSNGYDRFRGIIESLGGSPRATLFWDFGTQAFHTKPAYTFIMGGGMGDPLSGNAVVSASAYAGQGQIGFVHGTMARNINGLYQPYQTAQQKDDADDQAAGPDFTLTKLGAYPPVAWPELSGTLMSGADSVAGQEAAYHHISYTLLTNYYIDGVSGDFLDDIHYFFTGSNSNYINYHYFNPINLQLPAPTAPNSYCFAGPPDAPYSAPACFTENDFNTVRQQVRLEVVYLTNVLNFMVNGPVNMKDIVATGNSNAGLALTNAAANILSSSLTATTAPVKVNTGNVLSMLAGLVSVGAAVASGGDSAVDKDVNFALSSLGGLLGASGGVLGGFHTGGQTTLPSRFGGFTTTIGELANSNLQGQLAIGFDEMLDSILSDWGKLSTLGPKISDNRNSGYYSPNQVAQNAAIQLMTQASQRSFYMSLLPSLYQVHFWPNFFGVNPNIDFLNNSPHPEPIYTNQPDMGSVQSKAANQCAPFYMQGSNSNANAIAPALGFVWMPSPANGLTLDQLGWGKNGTFSPSDYYLVVSNQVSQKGTPQTSVSFMADSLSQFLFTPSGLNIPVDMFVNPGGPMQSQFQHMDDSTTIYNNTLGFRPNEVCDARPFTIGRGDGVGGGEPEPPADVVTITTLQTSASAVLGEDFTIRANVTDGTSPVTAGSVIFLQDQAQIATVPLDASGAASFTVSNLALGAHTFQALYSHVKNYESSESSVATVKVYANGPDLGLSLSAASLPVSYGTTSSAVMLQAVSRSGSTGTVTFSCSGLPVGMTCQFNPAQATLGDGATVSTTLTITSTSAQAAARSLAGVSATFLFSLPLLCFGSTRIGRRHIKQCVVLGVLLVAMGTLSACSGGGSSPAPQVQEKGAKTILVNATCGPVTKSIPLVLNIQ